MFTTGNSIKIISNVIQETMVVDGEATVETEEEMEEKVRYM